MWVRVSTYNCIGNDWTKFECILNSQPRLFILAYKFTKSYWEFLLIILSFYTKLDFKSANKYIFFSNIDFECISLYLIRGIKVISDN